jgi:hypothetical protein
MINRQLPQPPLRPGLIFLVVKDITSAGGIPYVRAFSKEVFDFTTY